MNIAGMVLGIIAIMFAWIPIIGFISIPLVVIGLPLSFFGLLRSRRRKVELEWLLPGWLQTWQQ